MTQYLGTNVATSSASLTMEKDIETSYWSVFSGRHAVAGQADQSCTWSVHMTAVGGVGYDINLVFSRQSGNYGHGRIEVKGYYYLEGDRDFNQNSSTSSVLTGTKWGEGAYSITLGSLSQFVCDNVSDTVTGTGTVTGNTVRIPVSFPTNSTDAYYLQAIVQTYGGNVSNGSCYLWTDG